MFYCPTRIIMGDNALDDAAEFLHVLGKNALIVSGENSARLSGALDELIPILHRLEIRNTVFAEVKENPDLDCVLQGAAQLKAAKCDFIIAIGGGSPIDAAKAISLAAANGLNKSQLYQTDLFRKAYPIVSLPTTSGTGSEVTQYSVLTDTELKRKAGFGHVLAFPRLAILNPRYTYSLPPTVTLHTALDALSHLLEGLYSKHRDPLVYPLIYKGISCIMEHLPTTLKEPDNEEAREALMRASLYGGMVIAQGSTTLQHSIGYPLTAEFGVAHGLANALVLQEIMHLFLPAVKSELAGLFAAINCTRDDFFAWLNSLPFQHKLFFSDEFIAAAVPQIMGSRNMALNPLPVSEAEVRRILDTIRT